MKSLLLVLILSAITVVHAQSSTRKVPACPKGARERTWDWNGEKRYACEAPGQKTDAGLDSCYEWEGTHWNPEPGLPCGSSVGNTSDKEYLSALKMEKAKRAAFVDPPLAPAKVADDENPSRETVFLVVKSTLVAIGNTDANGYRHNEGPPLQRVVGKFNDGGFADLLCYGVNRGDGMGFTLEVGKCPRLEIGKKYRMTVGRRAFSYNRPDGTEVDWQVLEVCSPEGQCQQISTIHDR